MLAQIIKHKGQEMVFSDLRLKSSEEMIDILKDASEKLSSYEKRGISTLYLLDLTGVPMTEEFSHEAMRIAKKHVPFIRKSAIIGVTGIKRMFFEVYLLFTKSKMRSFQTKDAAMEYLVS